MRMMLVGLLFLGSMFMMWKANAKYQKSEDFRVKAITLDAIRSLEHARSGRYSRGTRYPPTTIYKSPPRVQTMFNDAAELKTSSIYWAIAGACGLVLSAWLGHKSARSPARA